MNTVNEPGTTQRRDTTTGSLRRRRAAVHHYPPGALHTSMTSPVGKLDIVVDAQGRLLRIAFEAEGEAFEQLEPGGDAVAPVVGQLTEYFAGERQHFDLEVAPEGSAFQQRVWAGLLTIPFGETLSYGQLAARLGDGAHARAVGTANGRNPIPIVIPCHRVIGADGSLTGYGGGLDRKRHLLALEGASWRE